MNWLAIATWIFRLVGFYNWAETIEKKWQAKKKAQEQANVPITNKEEVDNFGKW